MARHLLCLTAVALPPLTASALSRHVDSTGSCGGNTPCYSSINAALSDSTGGDVIYVYPGVYAENVNLKGMFEEGDIALVTVNAAGNPSPGAAIIDPGAGGGPMAGDALYATFGALSGNVVIDGFSITTASGSVDDAIDIEISGNVLIRNCAIRHATRKGIAVYSNTGNITILDTLSNANREEGFFIRGANASVNIGGSSAVGNLGNGFDIEVGGEVIIDACAASYNFDTLPEGDGFHIAGDTHILISNSRSIGNSDDGFDVVKSEILTLDAISATGNRDTGYALGVSGKLNITRLTAIHNGARGIQVEGSGSAIYDLDITDSRITDNGTEGIAIDGDDLATDNFHAIRGSVICGNLSDGLSVGGTSAITITAEGNWWGSLKGPAHASNPGGNGDGINNGTGTVDYAPWIDTVTSRAVMDPLAPGRPGDVAFTFSGGSNALFLGEGPGDPNNAPPFSVSVDNGVVSHGSGQEESMQIPVTGDTGTLTATVTAETTGVARVSLAGPCGFLFTRAIDVTRNSLELFVEKNSRTGNYDYEAGDSLVVSYELRPSLGGYFDGRLLDGILGVQADPAHPDKAVSPPPDGGPISLFGTNLSGPAPLNMNRIPRPFRNFSFPPTPAPLTGSFSFLVPGGVRGSFSFIGGIVNGGGLTFLSGVEVSNEFTIE